MNVYVVAPKDDPLGREEWREPYGAATLDEFAALVAAGQRSGVSVGFAVSPGLSIAYSSPTDFDALTRKLTAFVDRGARFLCLALDDVSSELCHDADRSRFDSLAAAHVDLANRVHATLPADCVLWLVPTDYAGPEPSDYLEALGAGLRPDIEVGWTGRTVVSPTIERGEAEARSQALRRRLLVWDNVPVSDGPMRPMLHLGPYRGRDVDLPTHVSGILLNPMQHPRASAVCLRTAADYLADPTHYDPEQSWQTAIAELGAGAPDAFADFAAAHRFSALAPRDRDREVEDSCAELFSHPAPLSTSRLASLAALLHRRRAAAPALRRQLADRSLVAELEPWLASHECESERMEAAVELLEVVAGDHRGMEAALAFFRFQGRLTRLPTPNAASYGPRRVLYPQLASLQDESARFGDDPALFVDHCLADALVRFAEERALANLGGAISRPIRPGGGAATKPD